MFLHNNITIRNRSYNSLNTNLAQIGNISEQRLENNDGALYGYYLKVEIGNSDIVIVTSHFANTSTYAAGWYSVCYIDSDKRHTRVVVAPLIYGSHQNNVSACRIYSDVQFQIYTNSRTLTYMTFAFSYTM